VQSFVLLKGYVWRNGAPVFEDRGLEVVGVDGYGYTVVGRPSARGKVEAIAHALSDARFRVYTLTFRGLIEEFFKHLIESGLDLGFSVSPYSAAHTLAEELVYRTGLEHRVVFDTTRDLFIAYPGVKRGDKMAPLFPVLLDKPSALLVLLKLVEASDELYGAIVDKVYEDMTKEFIEKHAEVAEKGLATAPGKTTTVLEPREEYSEVLERGYGLERQGRELASRLLDEERESPVPPSLDRVVAWAGGVLQVLGELAEDPTLTEPVRRLAGELENLFRSLMSDARAGVLSQATVAALKRVDEVFREITGSGALWGPVTSWSSAVNSATSAFHRLLESLQRLAGSRALVLTKNPYAERWVKVFFSTIDEMLRRDLYVAEEDLEPTSITVTDREVTCRLGSAAGHAAHIDIERGVLEYYDADEDVKDAVLKLLKRFVPVKRFSIDPEKLVVEFDPTPENIERVVAVLPLAISMDYRMQELENKTVDTIRVRLCMVQALASEGRYEDALKEAEARLGIPRERLDSLVDNIIRSFSKVTQEDFHRWLSRYTGPSNTVRMFKALVEEVRKRVSPLAQQISAS